MTTAQVQNSIINDPFTINVVNVVIREYQAAFGRVPDQAGLNFWVDSIAANPSALTTLNTTFANSAEFTARFGATATTPANPALVSSIYQQVYNRAPDAEGLAYWSTGFPKLANGSPAPGAVPLTAAQLLKEFANSQEFITATAPAIVAFEQAELAGAAPTAGSLFDLGEAVAQTITLTDAIVTTNGASGNDVFNGIVNNNGVFATDKSTLNTGDIINGKEGVDTLKITVALNNGSEPVVELNSVENVIIRDLDGSTFDASQWNGVKKIGSEGSTEFTDVENVQNGVVISQTNTTEGLDVTYADNALGSANYEQVMEVNNFGDANNTVDMHLNYGGTDNVSAFKIAATGENFFEIGGGSVTAIEKLTITGAGSVEISDHGSSFDDATIVELSGNSGGVTLEVGNEDVKVTGGSGADVITLSNGAVLTDKAGISLGAGIDRLLDGGSAGVGTSAVLDGGAGIDMISSTLLEVGNAANIKGWEILDLSGETRSIDASLFSGSTFQSLALTDALGGDVTVSKLAGTAINVTVEASAGAGNDLTATLASSSGAADALNLNFDAGAGAALNVVTTTGVEAVTITSGGDDGAANSLASLRITTNTLASVTLTGSENFILSDVDVNTSATTASADVQAALTQINGSAASGDLTITAGQSGAIGASGFSTIYNGLTISTGSGDDTVTTFARNGFVNTGAGSDDVILQNRGVTVDVGADLNVDTVVLNAAAANTTTFTNIARLATGDLVDFSALAVTATTVNNFTTTANTLASLDAALAAAIADATSTVDRINWVDGNTYLAVDGSTDAVVKLVGVYSSFTADGAGHVAIA